jgi:hypothetical protein
VVERLADPEATEDFSPAYKSLRFLIDAFASWHHDDVSARGRNSVAQTLITLVNQRPTFIHSVSVSQSELHLSIMFAAFPRLVFAAATRNVRFSSSSSRPKTVLVVGSSGALGSIVSKHLSSNQHMTVLGADLLEIPSAFTGDWEVCQQLLV